MTDTTKFFSSAQPKVFPPPGRQLVVGDEWHPPEGESGRVKVWNGTEWADVLTQDELLKEIEENDEQAQREADAAEAERVQLEQQAQREAEATRQQDDAVVLAASNKKGGAK